MSGRTVQVSRLLIAAGVLVTLVVVNGLVLHQESVKQRGTLVLLPLAPVDPRSLIEGDYMALRYRAANDASNVAFSGALEGSADAPNLDGKLVVRLDPNQVGSFVRLGEAESSDEVAIRFSQRSGRVRIGAEAYYFEEGQAANYAAAKYGELRVASNGQSVLVGLRDAERQPIHHRPALKL